jgi:hypothetical protein
MMMKIKHLVISILLLVSCAAIGSSQQKPETGRDAGAPQAGMPALQAPALKAEDLLKIRDLQYAQAKRVQQMQQMEAVYKRLQDDQASDSRHIDDVIREAAKAANIDISKWVFDAETLKFVPRPAEKPQTGKP